MGIYAWVKKIVTTVLLALVLYLSMAVIAYESAVDVEWLDEEFLDTSDVPVAEPVNNREEQITVITTDEHYVD